LNGKNKKILPNELFSRILKYAGKNYTLEDKSLPGLNFTTFLAAMLISLPV
jgi:hypothetical protein